MQEGDSASIVIRHEALNIEPNGAGEDANAFVMEARLLGRASLIHLSVPTGTEELHFHARVPGLNSLQTGSPVRITVDAAQAFVFRRQNDPSRLDSAGRWQRLLVHPSQPVYILGEISCGAAIVCVAS